MVKVTGDPTIDGFGAAVTVVVVGAGTEICGVLAALVAVEIGTIEASSLVVTNAVEPSGLMAMAKGRETVMGAPGVSVAVAIGMTWFDPVTVTNAFDPSAVKATAFTSPPIGIG